jgi:hypothetical protein
MDVLSGRTGAETALRLAHRAVEIGVGGLALAVGAEGARCPP